MLFFKEINPSAIAIITRQTKGRFAASSISFKLESLIQCYTEVDIEFVAKATLTAHYKKNPFSISVAHSYQENAAQLAAYLLR